MKNKKNLIIFIDSGDTIIDEATQVFDDRGIVTEASFIEGAQTGIRQLFEAGHRIALVADGEVDSFENVYNNSGIRECFEGWVISETVGLQKPEAIMFETAMKALNLEESDKSRIVMVGNNLRKDIKGGNNFGIKTIWMDWSPRYFQEIEQEDWKPDYRATTMEDLLSVLDKIEKEL